MNLLLHERRRNVFNINGDAIFRDFINATDYTGIIIFVECFCKLEMMVNSCFFMIINIFEKKS